MPFPEVSDYDFSKGGPDNKKMREALDYAEKQHKHRSTEREKIEKLYNAYNGYLSKKEKNAKERSTGKQSKTKYVKYRLGRSKVKQLQGEFLEIRLTPTVRCINPEARNEEMQKYKQALGLSIAKPYIEKARGMGFKVYDGFNIPDQDDPDFWSVKNFKKANSLIMQDIILDKVKTTDLKIQLYHNFIDNLIAAKFGGKIERNSEGEDVYRYIPANNMLYEEQTFDPFLERTPYKGEIRNMYLHEIINNPEFKLRKSQESELKQMAESGHTSSENVEGSDEYNSNYVSSFDVYTIEWKGLETIREKVSPSKSGGEPYRMILSDEYYQKNKKKIENDVAKGKYELEVYYQEVIWTASKIADEIYTTAEKTNDVIQTVRSNGKYEAHSNYVGCLFSTVNGERISMQEILYELENIYDDIRYQINREIKKIRGQALIYDRAFLPKNKRFIDIIHNISEDGVVEFNSSAEGNRSGLEAKSSEVNIQAIDFGENKSIMVLMNQAMDIERTMDRITGMNENRQGLTKATTTATTNINNIEASRSVTYDLFYMTQLFSNKMLTKLAEKSKLNKDYYKNRINKFLFDDNQVRYMEITDDLMADNYAVYLSDGRKEQDILSKLEQMFPQEINAGIISTSDVAKFLTEDNFHRALKVLDQARTRYEEFSKEQSREEMQQMQQAKEQELKEKREEREDKQAHDRDMEALRTEGKKEVKAMEISGKGSVEAQKQKAEMVQDQNEME